MSKIIRWIHSFLIDPVHAYQAFHAARYITSVLISIVMVKSSMPTLDLGHFEFILFFTAAFTVFWSTGVKNALLSFYKRIPQTENSNIFQSVFWILFLLGFLIGLVVIIAPSLVINIFGVDVSEYLIRLGGLYIICFAPVVLTENVFYLKKEISKLNMYNLFSHVPLLLVIGILAVLQSDICIYLIVLIVYSGLKSIYLMYSIGMFKSIKFDKSAIKKMMFYSSPLMLNMLVASAMDIVDGWFVSHYFDGATFAIFRYGARELPFSSLLFASLSAALIPQIIDKNTISKDLKTRCNQLMHILFPISIFLMFLSPTLFKIAYNDTFTMSADIFNIYLLILISRVLLPQSYMMAYDQHKVLVVSGIMELILNISLSFWWLQIWGIYGLVFATVVSYSFQKIILIFYNKFKNNIPFTAYVDVRFFSFYSVLSIVSLYISFKYLS